MLSIHTRKNPYFFLLDKIEWNDMEIDRLLHEILRMHNSMHDNPNGIKRLNEKRKRNEQQEEGSLTKYDKKKKQKIR